LILEIRPEENTQYAVDYNLKRIVES